MIGAVAGLRNSKKIDTNTEKIDALDSKVDILTGRVDEQGQTQHSVVTALLTPVAHRPPAATPPPTTSVR